MKNFFETLFPTYKEFEMIKNLSDELKNLIYSYYWGAYENRSTIIRKIEKLSEYRLAAYYWNIIGNKSDANACTLLADAIQAGDEFRERNIPQ